MEDRAMNPIKLSISLLASNRLDTIRRCLDSLKPIMEQIPSELILVDTSKNPEVHEILLEYTDKVVEFEWCNDFSKARNAGMVLAKGEWFMFLDDDEWFVEIEPLIHFFQSGEYKQYGCANYIVRNFMDPGYVNYSDSWVSRMIKRDEETHFESKIHEYLYPVKGSCKTLPAIAYHSGYIYLTEADKMKHFERNATLLKEMINEEPEILRWKVQLAQEYRSAKKWEDQYAFCLKCIEETINRNSKYENYDIGTFYAGATEALLFLKRYEDGIAMGERALKDVRTSPMCHAYIYLAMSSIYFSMNEWDKALDYAFKYQKICRNIKKDPRSMEDQKSALLVGEALDAIATKRAYSVIISCGLKKKDTSMLKKYADKLEWDNKVLYAYDGLVDALVEAMAELPYEPIFGKMMDLAWKNSEMQRKIWFRSSKLIEKNTQQHRNFLRVLAQMEGEDFYLCYAKVIIRDADGEQEKVVEWLSRYYKNAPNIFQIPEGISIIQEKNNFPLEENLLGLHFEKWSAHLLETISNVSREELHKLEKQFLDMKTQEHVLYDYFFMRISEAQMLYSVEDDTYEDKKVWIQKFTERACAFYREYHTKDAIEKYSELLPDYARGAFALEKAFTYEKSWPEKFVSQLTKVTEVNKATSAAIASFIEQYGEELRNKRKEQEKKEEYEKLRLEKIQDVQKRVVERKYPEALEILNELKEKNPQDLEVADLILQIRLALFEGNKRG